jgi:spore maturation protein CgeB
MVLVFKGGLLKPETIFRLRDAGKPLYNFYPDVSFVDHGPRIPSALRHYDCVFTTKSFHGDEEKKQFGIRGLAHVRHGFDPEVHRPVELGSESLEHYNCDASFVGCWSKEKEARLLHILEAASDVCLKVFGLGWHYASREFKRRMGSNLLPGVFGDELAMAYCASKVNLCLLSASSSNPNLRDQTTARTFQIPASRAFMLHEDTPEARQCFVADREAVFFRNNDEMVEKLRQALASPDWRESVSEQGYQRCLRDEYGYSSAARTIMAVFAEQTGRASEEVSEASARKEPAFALAN